MNTPAIVGVADSELTASTAETETKPSRPIWHYIIAVKVVLVGLATIASGIYGAWIIAKDALGF